MDIRIGQIGKIISGDDCGMYLKIMDDSDSTGGYLILTSFNIDMSDGFDNWTESYATLVQYFVESDWVIEWVGDS